MATMPNGMTTGSGEVQDHLDEDYEDVTAQSTAVSPALRAQVIEECAKWHEGQFDKYAQLAKEAPDMVSNGIHADFAQFHMEAAAGIRGLKRLHPVSAIGSADAVDWRQRYFEAREALTELLKVPELADIDPEDRSEECWAAESKARAAVERAKS